MTKNAGAIVTFDWLPDLVADDELFLREVIRAGLAAEPAVWSANSVENLKRP